MRYFPVYWPFSRRIFSWEVVFRADDTQDPEEDEQQLTRVKDWINGYQYDKLEITDVLSNFPDISVVGTLLLKLSAQ